jgi:hypothetical protein
MSEVARAVNALFDKLFEILDLSFVIAGATFIAALAWDPRTSELDIPKLVEGPLGIAILVVAAHTAGMTCFAAGRQIRNWLTSLFRRRPPVDELFGQLIRHGVIAAGPDNTFVFTGNVDIPWMARYVEGPRGGQPYALYARMWAEVRQQERLLPSFSLVRRYWVSAATLDGLFIALLTWSVFLIPLDGSAYERVGVFPSLLAAFGAGFCLWEARRYAKYQIEEIVGTVVHAYDPTGAAAVHGALAPRTSQSNASEEANADSLPRVRAQGL